MTIFRQILPGIIGFLCGALGGLVILFTVDWFDRRRRP